MSGLRQRENDERVRHEGDGGGGGADIDAVRDNCSRLLDAGDAAISRVLSGDSQRFTDSNQQQTGE